VQGRVPRFVCAENFALVKRAIEAISPDRRTKLVQVFFSLKERTVIWRGKIQALECVNLIVADGTLDLEQLRERLRKMNNAELLRFGQSAKYMCSPEANLGHPPRESFVIQLREAREEWKRRNPKLPLSDPI
jgi:hypothetical protein